MKKSSKDGVIVVNWTIPAFQSSTGLRTCPNAGVCSKGCYARLGKYAFNNVKRAHEAKLELTQSDQFVDLMIKDIEMWLKKRNLTKLYIRIHDAGDFYSIEYLSKWIKIMSYFESDNRIKFYAYTKQVAMIKMEMYSIRIPSNFNLIFSFGGKQDHLIDINKDSHSKVFESIEALKEAGYVDGTSDDLISASGTQKIGLVYHGVKKWTNTAWDKVS